ncbi:SulP family inorganic anion transporter [Aquirufa sp.]|jgi:MFS superfamily sulfate permease-like transporter|uniref:SulP family inorganic anion transporter n=1 Tax=Aquirufa sp. TaxID=2676249 RepID=UPI00378321DD
MKQSEYIQSFIKGDWKSGIAVFLVALPLCLGIALASGAPLLAGLVAGIVGGTLVSLLSGSELSVSGPAAGLTIIVATAIGDLGSFPGFLVAVIIAGLFQVALGLLKMGKIGGFFPSSVIRGMLVAIGIVIILKQIPHAIGDDLDFIGEFEFDQKDGENTFTEILKSLADIKIGALIISFIGLVILFSWTKLGQKFTWMNALPASLFVVLAGVGINEGLASWNPDWYLGDSKDHMVNLPIFASTSEIFAGLISPDWSFLSNPKVYSIAITLAIVATLESLLSLEATDSLDPLKRISSPDRELLAQGAGNIVSGLLGGLPITSVIVRSSTNVYSGGKSRMSGFFHGILLIVAVMLLPFYLNKIPLACLASILLYTGYKLAHPKEFKKVFAEGWKQYVPFLVTVAVVVGVDLLWGIFIGTLVGLAFVIITNYSSVFTVFKNGNDILIKFQKDVTFLHKMSLKETLRKIPAGSEVFIDATKVHFMDHDINLLIQEFMSTANERGIGVDLKKK